jgi:hypothetical protein
VVVAATGYAGSGPNANLPVALGGIVAAGALYAAIGVVVMKAGHAWIERLRDGRDRRRDRLEPRADWRQECGCRHLRHVDRHGHGRLGGPHCRSRAWLYEPAGDPARRARR